MQKILGYIRKACKEYDMIKDGDVIAVGVSGGKDSLVLLNALAAYSRFSPEKFSVKALTIDLRFGNRDGEWAHIAKMCDNIGVEYYIEKTDISEIVFNVRKEPNPCSLCAKMRRGALINAAEKIGCNKIALGHHNDDVIETFLMNLFNNGHIGCFSPVTIYPDKNLSLIRPLILAPESAVAACCKRNGFGVKKSECPADKNTARQETKEWIAAREKADRGFKQRIFGAMVRNGSDGWGIKGEELFGE